MEENKSSEISYKLLNFHIQGNSSFPMTSVDGLDSVIVKREDNYFLGTRYINEASDLLIYLILRKINLLIPSKTAEQGWGQFFLGKQSSHPSDGNT